MGHYFKTFKKIFTGFQNEDNDILAKIWPLDRNEKCVSKLLHDSKPVET